MHTRRAVKTSKSFQELHKQSEENTRIVELQVQALNALSIIDLTARIGILACLIDCCAMCYGCIISH